MQSMYFNPYTTPAPVEQPHVSSEALTLLRDLKTEIEAHYCPIKLDNEPFCSTCVLVARANKILVENK